METPSDRRQAVGLSPPRDQGIPRQRVFFALWPRAETQVALHECAVGLHAQCGGRLLRRETLHVTLAFLGEQAPDRLELLRRIAAGQVGKASDLVLDRCGSWHEHRIVWTGPQRTPEQLVELARALNAALRADGFTIDRRPFSAHVTLLRNARRAPPPLSTKPVFWRVDSFVLVASELDREGARYRIIDRWPLAGA